MKTLLVITCFIIAGCQTMTIPVTINIPEKTEVVTPFDIHVIINNCNNKAVPTTFEDLIDADGNTIPLTP